MTAVQWLKKELEISGVITSSDLEKAEIMEREQIEQGYEAGYGDAIARENDYSARQYFEDTYGKGGAK